MPCTLGIHHRRSIRLPGYDYSAAGAYFVTLCVLDRKCLFGDIVNDGMVLNDSGRMIEAAWKAVPERFHSAELDQFTVMPNHFHGIVMLNCGRGESCIRPSFKTGNANSYDELEKHENQGEHKVRPYGTGEDSLGRVIQAFKSLTTHDYLIGVHQHRWPSFSGKLWQRNYYEHVIRNDNELAIARDYIVNNPTKWVLDRENPENYS